MTGSPQAAASSAANPRPSGLSPAHWVRTGSAKTLACCSWAITCARGTAPMMRAHSDSSSSWMVRSSRARSGPSPTTINSRAAALRMVRSITSRQARSSVDTPLGNQAPDSYTADGATYGGCLGRSEAFGIDGRSQPEQSPASGWAQSARDAARGIAGDGGEMITAVADPSEHSARNRDPRPPDFMTVGETYDLPCACPPQRRRQQPEGSSGTKDHPRRAGSTQQGRRSGRDLWRRQQQRSVADDRKRAHAVGDCGVR